MSFVINTMLEPEKRELNISKTELSKNNGFKFVKTSLLFILNLSIDQFIKFNTFE